VDGRIVAPCDTVIGGVLSAKAGLRAEPSTLVDVEQLVRAYYDLHPDVANPEQRVAFGTSGHRGSSLKATFNEAHILAITEAICRSRALPGTDVPLFIRRA